MLQRINLVPQKPLSEKLKVITPIILFLLIASILLTIFIKHRIIDLQITRTERENAAIQEEQVQTNIILSGKKKLDQEISSLTKERNELSSEVSKIESIRSRKRYYTKALNIISTSLPPSVKCRKISFKKESGTLDGIAVKYQDLPVLVNELTENDFIRFAVLKEVDRIAGNSTALTFKITFGID